MTSARWAQDDEALLEMIKDAVAGSGPTDNHYPGTSVPAPMDTAPIEAAPIEAAPTGTPQISEAAIARMRRAAKSAYTWRTIDQELDRLTTQSDSDLMTTAQVRGAGVEPHRLVQFHGENIDLDLEIGDQVLVGQVFPALQGVVTLQTASGNSVETPVDEVGCFIFPRPTSGPFRLRCDVDAAGVVTDWISLT